MSIQTAKDTVFKLIAEGVELDLFQDETILLSNNVTGLFDLGLLPSDFTRQITIPGTKKNNDFFQHVYDISIEEPYLFQTDRKVVAQFDFDGFYISQGYIQLEKVNLRENKYIESYEISLYGLLSSFKRDLQSITLNELYNLEKYNHVFSAGTISNSFSGSAYTGGQNDKFESNSIFTSSVDGHDLGGEIVYCLTDGGRQLAYQASLPDSLIGINNPQPFSGAEIVPQNFKPAMRLDLVIDAIFNQAQYTYESTFLSESRFDNTYVLLDRGLRYPIINGVDLETYGQITVGPVSGSSTPLTLVSGVTQSLLFTNVYDDPSFSITDSNGTYTPFFGDSAVPFSTALCEVTLNLQVTGSSTAYPILSIYRDGISGAYTGATSKTLDVINQQIRQDFLGAGGDKTYTLTQEFELGFYSGSAYEFKIGFTTGGSGGLSVVVGPNGNENSRLKIKTLDQLGDLSVIDIPSNMPYGTNGITCLDFLTSIQKKFNLQIYPSKTKPRHFIIETFNNWYKQGKVKPFDKFIDLDKRISVIPANNLGVREVQFGDTLDLDYLAQNFNKQNNREFGTTYFRDTQNFFSEGKLDVKSGVGASPLRYVAGSGKAGGAVSRLTAFYGVTSNTFYNVCEISYTTFYSTSALGLPDVGDIIYEDSLGNLPLTGYNFFRILVSPDIFEINPWTGRITGVAGDCSGGGGGPTS